VTSDSSLIARPGNDAAPQVEEGPLPMTSAQEDKELVIGDSSCAPAWNGDETVSLDSNSDEPKGKEPMAEPDEGLESSCGGVIGGILIGDVRADDEYPGNDMDGNALAAQSLAESLSAYGRRSEVEQNEVISADTGTRC
jgi:hypothetical protein